MLPSIRHYPRQKNLVKKINKGGFRVQASELGSEIKRWSLNCMPSNKLINLNLGYLYEMKFKKTIKTKFHFSRKKFFFFKIVNN